jgi:hypothetical protein
MEGVADVEGHHPAHAELSRPLGGGVEALRGPGDHDLARGVVVGDPHVAAALTDTCRDLGIGADECRHAARPGIGRGLGQVGTLRGQA